MKKSSWLVTLNKPHWMFFAFLLLAASCSQEEDRVLMQESAIPKLNAEQQEALRYYDQTALLLTE
ncbi:MAG: hypothetical protein ACLFQO_16610 [Cyclobacteriaceae bacterium]